MAEVEIKYVSSKLCGALVAELREDGLQSHEKCKSCGYFVPEHARTIPIIEIPKTDSNKHHNVFRGCILPKWSRSLVITVYMKKLEQALLYNNVDENDWPRALLGVVEEPSSAAWITTNIMNTKVKWSVAKDLFTQHFR